MSFVDLPQELLLSILRYVGTRELSNSLLTLSKGWSAASQIVLVERIRLSESNLHLFPPSSERLRELCAVKTVSISVCLKGVQHLMRLRGVELRSWDLKTLGQQTKRWEADVIGGLKRLKTFIPICRSLRAFEFRSFDIDAGETEFVHHKLEDRREVLEIRSLFDILALNFGAGRGLTSLTIEVPHWTGLGKQDPDWLAGLSPPSSDGDTGDPSTKQSRFHLCPLVARHLPHLRTLRIDVGSCCPEMLRLHEASASLPLQKLTIRMKWTGTTLDSPQYRFGTMGMAHGCETGLLGDRQMDKMQDVIEALHAKAPGLKVVRVVSEDVSSDVSRGKVHAKDYCTHCEVRLPADASWEDLEQTFDVQYFDNGDWDDSHDYMNDLGALKCFNAEHDTWHKHHPEGETPSEDEAVEGPPGPRDWNDGSWD